MGRGGLLDLEKHYALHVAQHSNTINFVFHALTLWPMSFTGILLLYFTPPLLPLPSSVATFLPFSDAIVLNAGFFLVLFYSMWYVFLDLKAGSLATFFCLLNWVGGSILGSMLGFSRALKVALICQPSCLILLIIGHVVFEKRVPAIHDNHLKSLLLDPFFILLQILQKLFNYEPYPGFQARVQMRIDADINEWKASKEKKST